MRNKIIKLSIAGAIALSGITLNAQPLEEAIKNTEISGRIVYRYNDYKDNVNANNSATNQYKLAVNLKSKVNDDVTVNSRMMAVNNDSTNKGTNATPLGTSSDGDTNLDFALSEVNFTYTGINNASFTLGKQGVFTPWTIARMDLGKEQTGSGLTGTYALGNVAFVGGYFNQTNFDVAKESSHKFSPAGINNGSNFMYAGISANLNSTILDAYYSNYSDVFDSYMIGIKDTFKFGSVSVSPFAKYTSLELDESISNSTNDENEIWQLGATIRYGMFKTFFAYGESGDEGGLVFVDYSAKTGMDYHWRITANKDANAKYSYLHTTAQLTDKLNMGIFYSAQDKDENNGSVGKDADEIYLQTVYRMSSNLLTYLRLGNYSDDAAGEDGSMMRAHIKYTF